MDTGRSAGMMLLMTGPRHKMNPTEGRPVHRAELIDAVIGVTSVPRAQVEAVYQALLEEIMARSAAGDKVTLSGFGTFESRPRAARTGRNPATGAEMQIAATRVVAFKAGIGYKKLIASTPTPADASRPKSAATGKKGASVLPTTAKAAKRRTSPEK